MKSPSPSQIWWLKAGLFLLATLPLVRLVVATLTDKLGANPMEFITRNTGDWTLYMLCIALAVTPLRKLSGWNWLVKSRRMLGLFAFFYATLHFVTFLWFDHAFDLAEMGKDVLKRPFVTAGFSAFVLLVPLAVTSTHAMVRMLGGKRWQRLHRLIYLAIPLGVLHFWWMKAAKNNVLQPVLFAVLVAALLAVRVYWWRQARLRAQP